MSSNEAFRESLTTVNWDVIILGASWAGINAAYNAKKAGAQNVLILEPTRFIGGMLCQAGITPIDQAVGSQIGGVSWQTMQRVKIIEGLTDSAAQPGLAIASSNVGNGYNPITQPGFKFTYVFNWEAELTRLIKQSGATLVLDAALDATAGNQWSAVGFSGKRMTSIRTRQGTFKGKVFIDADYEGDLLIAASRAGLAAYSLGQESASQYGESIAGAGYNPVTQTATGQDLTSGGVPLYPLVANPNRTAGAATDEIMAYAIRHKFRLIADGNAAAFTPPAGYDATKFASVAKLLTALTATLIPATLNELNGGSPYCYDVNNNGSLSLSNDLPNKSKGYPLGSPAQRQAIIDEHYHWGQGLYYFCQTDASVPSAVRTNTALYGFAKDHWADNRYQPRRMYIREGVRMVGKYVLTQNVIDANILHPDGIGKGSYPFDAHGPLVYLSGTNDIVTDGGSFGSDKTYRLPMGMIVPRVGDVENLLVPVCCSASHVAWMSVRMETALAQMGEAAGIIAAVAARTGAAVQDISYAQISTQLFDMKAITT